MVRTGARAAALAQLLNRAGLQTVVDGPPAPRLDDVSGEARREVIAVYEALGGVHPMRAVRPGAWDLSLVARPVSRRGLGRWCAIRSGWASKSPTGPTAVRATRRPRGPPLSVLRPRPANLPRPHRQPLLRRPADPPAARRAATATVPSGSLQPAGTLRRVGRHRAATRPPRPMRSIALDAFP